jgi:hypothetical protein
MRAGMLVLGAAMIAATPALAQPSLWHVSGGPAAPTFELSRTFPKVGVSYRFVCQRNKVAITETGVTQLTDPQTGKPVGDEPGSRMTAGASVMALHTDTVEAKLFPAVATPNSPRGWDLTIELPTNDPAFQSLATAKQMTLMTTGRTGMVLLGPADRDVIAPFVRSCAAR